MLKISQVVVNDNILSPKKHNFQTYWDEQKTDFELKSFY